jgi:hypothetical protein
MIWEKIRGELSSNEMKFAIEVRRKYSVNDHQVGERVGMNEKLFVLLRGIRGPVLNCDCIAAYWAR